MPPLRGAMGFAVVAGTTMLATELLHLSGVMDDKDGVSGAATRAAIGSSPAGGKADDHPATPARPPPPAEGGRAAASGPPEEQPLPERADRALPGSCAVMAPAFAGFLRGYLGKTHERVLVYNCEPHKRLFCGGTGDRMRGIVTSLFLAMVTGRRFRLYSPYPAPLTVFYDEAVIKWHVSNESEVSHIPVDSSLMRLNKHAKFMKHLAKPETDRIDLRVQANSFEPTNYALAEPRLRAVIAKMGLAGCGLNCFYACLFDLLFVPTEETRASVAAVTRGKPAFLGLQVRVSGPWATGLAIPEKWRTHPQAFRFFWAEIDAVSALPGMAGCPIFVTTDAPRFLGLVQDRYKDRVFFTPGEQFNHTDSSELHQVRPDKYQQADADAVKIDKFKLTLLNHYVLGEAQHMLMAQSGFGDTAFWRTRRKATCLFVNIDTYRTVYKHKLSYPDPSKSALVTDKQTFAVEPP
ncbi:putative membrane-associated protein [Diplonema papillatum]|nr:putative membrane-associated protein [Diplonema papillatum]